MLQTRGGVHRPPSSIDRKPPLNVTYIYRDAGQLSDECVEELNRMLAAAREKPPVWSAEYGPEPEYDFPEEPAQVIDIDSYRKPPAGRAE